MCPLHSPHIQAHFAPITHPCCTINIPIRNGIRLARPRPHKSNFEKMHAMRDMKFYDQLNTYNELRINSIAAGKMRTKLRTSIRHTNSLGVREKYVQMLLFNGWPGRTYGCIPNFRRIDGNSRQIYVSNKLCHQFCMDLNMSDAITHSRGALEAFLLLLQLQDWIHLHGNMEWKMKLRLHKTSSSISTMNY